MEYGKTLEVLEAGDDRRVMPYMRTGEKFRWKVDTLGWRPTCEHYPRVDEWQEYPDKRNMTDEEYEQVCALIRALRDELVRLWEPYDNQVPAVVFDPFAGSGTTLQVARALGRNGVGLDLSLEYLHLARQRLSLDALEAWGKGKKDGSIVTDLPMFEGLE
jgi:hypothetical protein